MTRVDWASHPAVRKIDIRKLSVLMALINQSEGKSFSEMIPSIIEANKHLTAMGLAFTNDEIKLLFDVMKKDMSSFLGAELQIIENMATKSKGIEHLEPVKKSADIQGL